MVNSNDMSNQPRVIECGPERSIRRIQEEPERFERVIFRFPTFDEDGWVCRVCGWESTFLPTNHICYEGSEQETQRLVNRGMEIFEEVRVKHAPKATS